MEQCRLMMELDPAYFISHLEMGETRVEQGAFDEAISHLRQAAVLSGNAPLVLGWLGMTLARSGDVEGAREVLAGLRGAASHMYVPPTSFAWIHLGLGEIDQAFGWMERAIEERDAIIVPIKTYPFMDPLRDDPRFAALLRRMNLESSAGVNRATR
jgi:tetratricopeptide (TPR) repeat protein